MKRALDEINVVNKSSIETGEKVDAERNVRRYRLIKELLQKIGILL